MSDFSLILLEAPVLPPGHSVQVGAHLIELLGLAVGLPLLIGVVALMIGMGPTWLKAQRAPKGEVEVSRQH